MIKLMNMCIVHVLFEFVILYMHTLYTQFVPNHICTFQGFFVMLLYAWRQLS